MNALNRLVMLVVALLLLVVPVLLLLINWGVIPAGLLDQYIHYNAGVDGLGGIANADLSATPVRVSIAIVGALVAIIALILLLRELTLGRVVSRSAVIQDDPGRETRLTSRAVRSLAEGAAREAGASSPSVSLTSKGRPYLVECGIGVPESGNHTEVASRTRENVRKVLEDQNIPVKDVEVTVQGNAS